MTEPKKRLWIRAPLTEEDYNSGQRYYSESDIEGVLRTVKFRSDLNQNKFAQDLETAAFWFVNLAAADKAKPPSTLQREWDRRAKNIETLLADLNQMSMQERADLEHAAEQLAQRTGELPDLAPRRIELPPLPEVEPSPSDYATVWPVMEQIEKSLGALRWLHQCFTEAASRARNDKAEPGNRPIEEKHEFFHVLIDLYNEGATAPDEPRKDRPNREYHGESLDFIEACLKPLGVRDSREVIHDTYYRVVEHPHRTRT